MQTFVRFLLALLICWAFPLAFYAQNEANIWYFGNGAGLNFNYGEPVALENGALYTDEGCATISDKNGRLLFYTNGVTVWDNTHSPMPNGSQLYGHKSSTQSAIIVPKPGSETLYYVFTVDEKAGSKGAAYSVVDMQKRNGKGDVTLRNRTLLSPVSEKLAAVKHSNGKDFWVIVHRWNSSAFYVYPVTSSGIGKPVVSKIGTVHKEEGSGNNGEAIGYLKPSPNGKKLASAISYKPENNIELFDFDPASGKISNLTKIPTFGYAYGLTFSPNNTKLYVSFIKGDIGLVQYDITTKKIASSGTILSANEGPVFGALQTGPDNRVYVARTDRYIDRINFPDKKGKACNYQPSAIDLKEGRCVYGLPDFVYYFSPSLLGKDTTLCAKEYTIEAPVFKNVRYEWSNGATTPAITVRESGAYIVSVVNQTNGETKTDTINVLLDKNPPAVDLGNDTTLCAKQVLLGAYHPGATYEWSTGETSDSIAVKESGTYRVKVTDTACTASDSIHIKFEGKPAEFRALTSFYPAGDFINTVFAYTIKNATEFKMVVRNSSGRKVFKTDNPKEEWDGTNRRGKKLPQGDYFWEVEYVPVCTGEKVEKEGKVSLIR